MAISKLISIPINDFVLEGKLKIADNARGLAVFAHGAGSSRHSSRNNFVAEVMHTEQIGTLLFDLLTEEEDAEYDARFDIELLTKRLVTVSEWLKAHKETKDFPLGYFGASTGAAAALKAAVYLGDQIKTVVSRGGRVDLAGDVVKQISCPVLLIVGERDEQVLEFNREIYEQLKEVEKHLAIIPGATHLFQEEGTLEEVAHIASQWFAEHL